MKTNSTLQKNTLLVALLFTIVCSMSIIAQEKINASTILSDMKNGKNISYKNAIITGTLDMTFMDEKLKELPKKYKWKTNGGNNSIEEQIEVSVSFVNCVFEDNVFAYIHPEDSGYTFVANFEGNVTFSNCNFKGNALFKYSDFEKDANFSLSKFKENTTFKYAQFDGKADFSDTIFEEDAVFKYSKFHKGVSFNSANFKSNLNIKYTKVSGNFDIKGMDVAHDIDSKYTKINGKGFSKVY